jgi:hypothetical protein
VGMLDCLRLCSGCYGSKHTGSIETSRKGLLQISSSATIATESKDHVNQ